MLYEQQFGKTRQMQWALKTKMVKPVGGRCEITVKGRGAMESAR
jgi:hypothetical protein